MIARNQIKSYDGISRFLHWAIALLVIWQLGGMLTATLSPKRAWIET
jgi:cytochrome b561